MATKKTKSTVATITGGATALAATWVAHKAVGTAWKAILGHEPPDAEDEGDARFAEVAVAAVITGAVVALVRVLATRGTAKFANRVDEGRLSVRG